MNRTITILVLTVFMMPMTNLLYAQDDDDMMDDDASSFMDYITVGALVGVSEPFTDENGTAGSYTTGIALRVFGQYDLDSYVKNLKVELAVGYTSFSSIASTGTASIIPIQLNGIYEIAQLTPDIGLFGFGGLGFNLHSWDFATDQINYDSQSVLGVNLGVGVSYPINQDMVANLRVGYSLSLTAARERAGSVDALDYAHAETPVLLGISYKL